MAHLRPCSECSRHVRANVTVCPFCDAALTVEAERPVVSHDRLGRAARMALGSAAALAISVAACDKPKENIAMPYGAPPDRPMPADASAPPTADTSAATADAATATATATASALPAPDAGKVKPPPTVTAKPPPTATATPNHNKPYGAPPADGYDVFDV